MRPESRPFRILAGLLAIPSILGGLFALVMAVLFLGNFNFNNPWHCLVFAVTLIAPLLVLSFYISYLGRETWRSLWLSLGSSALVGVTWLLWTAPLSRGLLH